MSSTHERVQFWVLNMQCCSRILCILTRLPNYCPECGKNVMRDVRAWIIHSDDNAMLTYTYHD